MRLTGQQTRIIVGREREAFAHLQSLFMEFYSIPLTHTKSKVYMDQVSDVLAELSLYRDLIAQQEKNTSVMDYSSEMVGHGPL